MLLTLSTTARPATDLGHLLHKHPDRAQAFAVSSGTAHVVYPSAGPEECTAALLLEVDPAALARRGGAPTVDARPYAAGSLLAVALAAVFSSAMKGRSTARPELAAAALPLTVRLPTVPCRGGTVLVERLFAPLGWSVEAVALPVDPTWPAWGDSEFVDVTLTGRQRVADALTHLYVLLGVLSDDKHYAVDAAEVDKLLRAGGPWLATHPAREEITRRYLAHRRRHVESALARLAESDDVDVDALDNALDGALDPPRTASLATQRRTAVLDVLRAVGAHRVLDLGCGDGALLRELDADPSFTEVVGVDVSTRALRVAARRLHLDRRPGTRTTLRQSALTYTDAALAGYDAAVLMEVVEHVDPERLPALEQAVFGAARPTTVVVTTPNVEHNVRFPGLAPGRLRHADHRFEWTRAQFRTWTGGVAAVHGYRVEHRPIGPDDPEVGPPTQAAVFTRGA